MPNLLAVKEKDFYCIAYNKAKAVRRLSKHAILDTSKVLNIIEGDTIKIDSLLYNKKTIAFFLIDRKFCYK